MKNWELRKLGEVCEFIGGSQPPKTVFSYVKKENYIRLIQIRDYKSDKHIVYIPKSQAKRFCNSTDIMIGRYGPPVFQILKGLDGAYNVALMKAVPNEKVLSKDFAFLFLKYSKIQDYIIHLSQRAAGQTGVNKEAIEDYPILLPPLPEQQRIVSILDEAFAAIAKAKANAEQNLNNAKELFESYLQSVFENKREDWEEKKLGEIASFSQGIQVGLEKHLTKPKDGYVRFIRIVDYTQNTDDIRYVPNPGEKYFVNEDDIVMVRYGTPGLIGRGKAGVIANNLFKITIERKDLLSDFLCLYLSQKHIQTYLSTQGSATMPALNFGQLKTVLVCFPSFKEQQTIVRNLDALSTETKKLETIYQKKINDLEELKKSVLQKAFSGELKINKEMLHEY